MDGSRPGAVSIPLALTIDDQELSRIVSRAADVLCLVDDDGHLLEVNRQGHLVLGYSPGEMSRLSLFDVDVDLDLADFEALRDSIERQVYLKMQRRFRCKDGTVLPVEVRVGMVRIEGRGRTLLVAARDIAEREEFQKRLLDALVNAEESSRSKSAFLGNLSHEIRTPLAAIVGYSSLVADLLEGIDNADAPVILARLEGATGRLLNMIHSTLDLSTIDTGSFRVQPKVVDLVPTLEREVQHFQGDADRKGLSLALHVGEQRPKIRFDPYCLSRAIQKLIDNAIKFTERGGVTVTLEPKRDGGFDLDVRDTGIGISSSYLPDLFEPFSQEDAGLTRRFEGVGIGLALAKRFVESNGAALSAESEKGKGSVFRIRFPKELIAGGARQRTAPPRRRSAA